MAASDFNDNNALPLVVSAVLFLILTYLSVILRTYVRAVLTKSFQTDDWLMLVSQAIFTCSCVFILIGVTYGIGRHNRSLPQDKEIPALMYQALATASYILNMMFIKLSIAVFLLRIAVQRRYIYTLWISMGIISIWTLGSFFWNLFQCSPVQAQWDYTIPGLHCVSPDEVVSGAYALSVMTILSDWLYALLPIPMIWSVKMTTQAKITVVAVLSLGVFASVATLIRLKFLSDLTDLADILHSGTDAMVWTLVEPGVAIVAASLVTIRPLLKQLRIPGFSTTDKSKNPSTGPSSRRSAAGGMQSQKSNRSRNARGPGDLTLIDLETGGDEDDESSRGNHTVRNQSHELGPMTRGGKGVPGGGGASTVSITRVDSDGLSESYVIQGAGRSPEPPRSSHGSLAGRSVHSEDHERLETHSQHDGRVGLGKAI